MISVLTTPRRQQYMMSTIEALDREGANGQQRCLFVDGSTRDVERPNVNWRVEACTDHEASSGTLAAMCSILLAAAECGEDLLYFEDDIYPCRRAVHALLALEVPDDCAFLVACDIASHGGEGPGLVKLPGDGEKRWGNQALKIPLRTLKYFARAQIPTSSYRHASDVLLGRVVAGAGAPWSKYAVLEPSIFRHRGEFSAVHPHWRIDDLDGRATRNYAGDNFNALKLLEEALPCR